MYNLSFFSCSKGVSVNPNPKRSVEILETLGALRVILLAAEVRSRAVKLFRSLSFVLALATVGRQMDEGRRWRMEERATVQRRDSCSEEA
jgi:hypothetical protein